MEQADSCLEICKAEEKEPTDTGQHETNSHRERV